MLLRSKPVRPWAFLLCGLPVALGVPPTVGAQPPAPAPSRPGQTSDRRWQLFARDWTRVEAWRFFEPLPGGGDPEYVTIANRLQAGVRVSRPSYDINASLQYVQFGNLPDDAVGPGPLGTGALYYVHSGDRSAHQVYLKSLQVAFKNLVPGLTISAGRMPYTSGAEAASGQATIEAVKRQRVDSRLIGEFEWAIFQRAYDGVRADFERPRWKASGLVALPTQGGFEDAAGVTMRDVTVAAGTANARPDALLPDTDVQVFALYYGDDRQVTQRPDNSGRTAARVDVGITTLGTTLTSAIPHGTRGVVDALAWIAGQTGRWYELDHGAYALAAEAGYQWIAVGWRPWVRAGFLRASGDDDPTDVRHGTFFQMLPTVRRYSLSATYSQMNLVDTFAQVMLRPRPRLGVRMDVHRVRLAHAADRWYAGSGATQNHGGIFGYVPRPSAGATGLGTVVEGSADYAINSRWSVNGYIGTISGGEIVRRTFAGTHLTFAYVEHVVQF